MANAPLNPPPANNNLLALVLQQLGPENYVDTVGGGTYPTKTTLTTTGTVTATFPLNGAGNQPTVSNGIYGIVIGAGATAQVTVSIQAVDSGAHVEEIDYFVVPAIKGGCFVRRWSSSLAAGTDVANSLATTIQTVQAVCTLSASDTGVTVQLVAAGTP